MPSSAGCAVLTKLSEACAPAKLWLAAHWLWLELMLGWWLAALTALSCSQISCRDMFTLKSNRSSSLSSRMLISWLDMPPICRRCLYVSHELASTALNICGHEPPEVLQATALQYSISQSWL